MYPKGGRVKKHEVIYNGVDVSIFKPGPKMKNEKINIVTHHWSNNRMKGFDTYEAIDRFVKANLGFTFTYIGRDLGTFKNTIIIPPLHGDSLANELSKYDVYISGSLFDPGPNHILEALACELPTYVIKDGGGAVEFADASHTFMLNKDLTEILLKKDFKKNKYKPCSWQVCVEKYGASLDSILMKFIAHRGNTNGPKPDLENSPDYILKAVNLGYDIEVDVWWKDDKWYLGHDEPQYEIDVTFLRNKKFWCHAKDIDALMVMLRNGIHCFWHQEDDCTLTSEGFIWTYPGKELVEKSICVMPENVVNTMDSLSHISGICSDYISKYQENIFWRHVQ